MTAGISERPLPDTYGRKIIRSVPFIHAVLIYTLFFVIFSAVSYMKPFIYTGALFSDDSAGQYYPFLLELRRCLISFFDSISAGDPHFPMLDFATGFGEDVIATTAIYFLPFLPYYIFSVFVPESGIALFLSIGTVLQSYIAGIAFIYLCSHFGKNTVSAGIFACMYVFCGNYFAYGLFFPHFIYMFTAFPLMIVGIDRIISGRGHILFTLTVFFLALGGITQIIYLIPFVFIFAVVRVYFVHRSRFPSMLLRCFLRGLCAFLIGLAMSCIILMPFIAELLASSRGVGTPDDIISMLIPSADRLLTMFSVSGEESDISVIAAAVPVLLFASTSLSAEKELKAYSILTLFIVSLPVVAYGLNGFQYEDCRWGCVPSLVSVYCCVEYIPKLSVMSRRQRAVLALTTFAYTAAVCLMLEMLAVAVIAVAAVINIVPFLRKRAESLEDKASERLKKLPGTVRTAIKGDKKYVFILLAVVIGATVMIGVMLIIAYHRYMILPRVLAGGAAVIAAALLAGRMGGKKGFTAVAGCVIVLAGMLSLSWFKELMPFNFVYIEDDPFYTSLSDEISIPDKFVRYANVEMDRRIVEYTEEESSAAEDGSAGSTGAEEREYLDDLQENVGARYEIPSVGQFSSTINGDLIGFLRRCGQDGATLMSYGKIFGFSGKEVLYSLFGVNRLFTGTDGCDIYGAELSEVYDCGDYTVNVYDNPYAAPIASLYSDLMTEDEFGALSPAELPYSMLARAYIEKADAPAGVVYSGNSYSSDIPFRLEQKLRGSTKYGIDVYDNTVYIDSGTADSLLYLIFEGVHSRTSPALGYDDLTVKADDKLVDMFYIMNENSYFTWKIQNDMYTVSLGYCGNDIHRLDFISRFSYDSLRVVSIPASAYIEAAEERNAQCLRNTVISTDTVSGTIKAENDGVISFTLLYSDGYTAYVDGEEKPVCKVNGLFVGVPVTAGDHEIKLTYRTPMLYEGAVVSLAGSAAFLVVTLRQRRRRRSKV